MPGEPVSPPPSMCKVRGACPPLNVKQFPAFIITNFIPSLDQVIAPNFIPTPHRSVQVNTRYVSYFGVFDGVAEYSYECIT